MHTEYGLRSLNNSYLTHSKSQPDIAQQVAKQSGLPDSSEFTSKCIQSNEILSPLLKLLLLSQYHFTDASNQTYFPVPPVIKHSRGHTLSELVLFTSKNIS